MAIHNIDEIKKETNKRQPASFGKPAMNSKKKERFYNDLSILINSGLDIKTAFKLIIDEKKDGREKEILTDLHDQLLDGTSLADAMEKHNSFSPYEYHSIRIGEETGKLKEVIINLSAFFQNKVKQQRIISGALTYPVLVLVTAIVVLFFMFYVIVPMFKDVFARFGGELPGLTKTIVNLSDWFSGHLILIVIIIAGIFLLSRALSRSETWKRKKAAIVLKLPVYGNFYRKLYLSRFAQAMALMNSANVHLIVALRLIEKMINFHPISKTIAPMIENMEDGTSFYDSLKKHDIYDPRMLTLVKVAEEVNALDTVFKKLSEQYEEELNHQSQNLSTILEPILIIVVGGIVALILISMYLPMFKLSTTIY